MTKVKFSGTGITAMSGSAGNKTITRNAYGYYAKNKIPGPAVISPLLAAWQIAYGQVMNLWFRLSDQQRNSWGKAAQKDYLYIDSLAVKRRFTGVQLFLHLNLNLTMASLVTVNDPPTLSSPPNFRLNSIHYTAGVDLSIIGACNSVSKILFYTSSYLSVGRMSTNQLYYFVESATSVIGNHSYNILAAVTTRFGVPPPGMKQFFKIQTVSSSGVRGVPFFGSKIY